MNQSTIKLVNQYLYQECGLETQSYTTDTSLFLSGLLDSVDVIQLIVFLEKTFTMKINAFDVTLEKLDTVNKIANYVEEKGTIVCT